MSVSRVHPGRAAVILSVVASLAGSLFAVASPASAASGAGSDAQFEPGHIVSDANFFDPAAMTIDEVQAFLDKRVKKCSAEAQAPCLKDWTGTQHAQPATTERCLTDLPRRTKQTAAEVIVAVATACGISPRVLLVTLQKEQGLVTQRSPRTAQYNAATGYACPDTPSGCDATYRGFANQVYWAARAFRAYAVNFEDRFGSYQPGEREIRYQSALVDSDDDCGTASVVIDNVATTALYTYTPYTPNAESLAHPYRPGDDCSSYGNRNFWLYYNAWFGDSRAGDYLLSAGDNDYFTLDGVRLELLAGSSALADSLAALGTTAPVSAIYLETLTPGGSLGALVQDAVGGYYLVADGKRYALGGCSAVLALGFDCRSADALPPAVLDRIPVDTSLAAVSEISVTTPDGARYLLGGGERRAIADLSRVRESVASKTIVLDESSLVGIPVGDVVVAPGVTE